MNPWRTYLPYLVLAVICATACVVIVLFAMMTLAHGGGVISDNGMLAIAGMAAAPALLGIGIASSMSRDGK